MLFHDHEAGNTTGAQEARPNTRRQKKRGPSMVVSFAKRRDGL